MTIVTPFCINWDSNTQVSAGTSPIVVSPWSGATVISCTYTCAGGSFVADIQKNGTPIPGLGSLNVAFTPTTTNVASGGGLSSGDELTLVISSISGTPVEALIQVNIEIPDTGEIIIPFCLDWDSNTGVMAGTSQIITAPWSSANVVSCTTSCRGGSFTADVAINGTSVPGLGSLNVTSSLTTTNPSSGGAISPGDDITVVISGVDGSPPPANAIVQVNVDTATASGVETVVPFVLDWDSNTPIANGTSIILISPWTSGVALSCTHSCTGGSFTANIQINGVSIGGLGALNVTSSPTTTNVTGSGVINPGDKVTLVISGADPPVGALLQFNVDTSLVLDSPETGSPEAGGGEGGDGGSAVPGNAGTGAAGTGISGVAPGGPFYFAWVQPTDNTWTSEFAVWDENIFDFVIEHTEGNFPTLTITVPNPFEGFLNPNRLYWAWFAWQDPVTAIVYPLFFGRLVGIPNDLVNQTVEMKFIARPTNYIQVKQLVAETLKVAPYYDPIWIPFTKRDDPDTILEGWSSLYHIDRVTLNVSASDILIGEDGTLNFGGGTAFYDSVKIHLDQPPLIAVNVAANVTWEQEYEGNFPVTAGAITTYTGEGFISDWPRTGAGLGGGYTVGVGWAANSDGAIKKAQTLGDVGYTFSYQNLAKKHRNGDTMSLSMSYSHPAIEIPGITKTIFLEDQIGILNPDTVDGNGDPAPINIPAKVRWTNMTVVNWNVSYALSVVYKAKRQRNEWIFFTLLADTQPIITDPLVTEDTEQINISSSNLSLPELTLLNWSSVAGQPVALGEMVFPDNPQVPGQTSTQIAVQAGTAGLIEPIFSNIAGDTTDDGTVVWSSLGATAPLETAGDWNREVNTGLGTLMIPLPMVGKDIVSLILPGQLSWPPTGVVVGQFDVFSSDGTSAPGSTMLDCTHAGMVGGGASSAAAGFQEFTNPTGMFLYICTQAGQTGEYHTSFNETPGSTTTDGTVVWTNVGRVTVPVGGWPGFTGASYYLPTDRGLQSVENLICRARAKLRKRARAVTASWETPLAQMTSMSCRMNATITDPRIPGGAATGKVVAYQIMGNGDTSVFKGKVTIGCSIGLGDHQGFTPGTPGYTSDSGYMQPGYQMFDGSIIPTAADDVGFTPPVPQTTDDGLVFPLTPDQAILAEYFTGSQAAEQQVIEAAFAEAVFQGINGFPSSITVAGSSSVTVSNTEANFPAIQAALDEAAAQGTGLVYNLSMRPLTNGPFSAAYTLDVTNLVLPQTINLEAASPL